MEKSENRIPLVRRHNPLTFYLRTLLYMFIALSLRIVAFLPLLALKWFPDGSYFRWIAALCPVLLIFFILPERFSFAQALVQRSRERRFSLDQATGLQNYGEKLGESLLHALHVLKWGIPLAAMLGWGYYLYNNTDAISLMKGVGDLGAGVTAVWCAVANFFISTFGGTPLVANGSLMEGIYAIGAMLGLGVLILMWGVMRNSAYRYIWALATLLDKDPHAEARRRLRGRRWKQFWVAMLNLVLWTPALFVVFTTLKGVLSDMSNAVFNYMATQQLNLPELSNAVWPLLFAFLVCYMPLLPVRRILTAFFATKNLRHLSVQPDIAPTEIAGVTTTSSGAPEPMAAPGAATETAAQMATGQAYAPFTQPEPTALNDEAEMPTPVPEPVPAYQPYHAAEPAPAAQPVEETVAATASGYAEEATTETIDTAIPPAEETQPVPMAEPAPEPVTAPANESVAVEPAEAAVETPADSVEAAVETAAEAPALAEDAPTVADPAADAAAEAEEPVTDELEDFFAQPFQGTQAAPEDRDGAEDEADKPYPPTVNGDTAEP
ncbi:MAG TPA: hypothetical protein PLP25_03515 [Candidatus Limiplasma sp.]|nr:hypothetical protein [Candidatus Limiplasma sp.]HPS80914.1 hypothetical protein [Candidatus Limiplasma sp.]